ncbi:response regulator transcription factor [Actinoplanes sp. DH11]|uniref:response regulator transcription factor n=1 Tax=Actinoplanes sp. DH11 TaxID=2857011 RepID=UPI001E5CC0CC|nr:response regulator transcription factor [Actinoplanes sp. DH11]
MATVIEIGAIDNDQMLLEGMAAWIARSREIALTAMAVSVEEYLAMPRRPEIVILDLNLENFTDPAENVRRLVAAGHVVVIVSVIPDPVWIAATTEAGARAYVPKANNLSTLADVIRQVAAGDTPLTTEHAFWLGRDARPGRPELSVREREVLVRYGSGMTLEAVGRVLGIAPGTVRTYLDRIKEKYARAGRPITHRVQYGERAKEDGFGRTRLPPST